MIRLYFDIVASQFSKNNTQKRKDEKVLRTTSFWKGETKSSRAINEIIVKRDACKLTY